MSLEIKISRFDIKERTLKVNFQRRPSLEDDQVAGACVAVLTSDGSFGTISHLTIADDPVLFGRDLRDFLGKPDPVCLSGGWEKWKWSVELVQGLVKSLKDNNFPVSTTSRHSNLLGSFVRKAILYADHVEVLRGRTLNDLLVAAPITLHFPPNSQT